MTYQKYGWETNDPDTFSDNTRVRHYGQDIAHRIGHATSAGLEFLADNGAGLMTSAATCLVVAGVRGFMNADTDSSFLPAVNDALNVATYNDRLTALQYNTIGNIAASSIADMMAHWKLYLGGLAAGPVLQSVGRAIGNIRVR